MASDLTSDDFYRWFWYVREHPWSSPTEQDSFLNRPAGTVAQTCGSSSIRGAASEDVRSDHRVPGYGRKPLPIPKKSYPGKNKNHA